MSEKRIIDANALLTHECEADKMGAMLVVGKGYILDAPTVPAEVVVHCRECKHYQEDNINWCTLDGLDRNPADYCSYGERRESEVEK